MGANMQLHANKTNDDTNNWVKIIEQIYRLNLDNRILNNLRQQLNEMIEDERGLVQINIFKKLFFTYFKGEKHAHQIYEMLLPAVSLYYDPILDEQISPTDDVRATQEHKFVKI